MAEIKLPSADQFDEIIKQMKIANKDKGQDDYSSAPGGKSIIAGDANAGFYGFVQPHEFGQIGSNEFNGVNLASAVGISQGTAQFSETPWMKFSWRGKILFVPLKAIRYSVSWDHIYQAGAVYGTGGTISDGEQFMLDNDPNYGEGARVSQNSRVTIDGLEYIVRLMRGAGNDPTDSYSNSDRGSNGADNEWNNLILPLHANAPSSFNYNQYADVPRPDWGFGLTDEILQTHNRYGTGTYSWMQETRDTIEGSEDGLIRRVFRGHYGASFLSASHSYTTSTNRGWRPVLELL
jgi:hypothetical protein